MAKFSIQDYLRDNKIEIGSIKKEVGETPYKGGHNDIRKTNYDVKIVDGKLDLYTHKTIITENAINENVGDIRTIADIFARFLIGDRPVAIRQLQGEIKNSFGKMKPGGTSEWTRQFEDLTRKLEQAIKSAL